MVDIAVEPSEGNKKQSASHVLGVNIINYNISLTLELRFHAC